MVLLAPVKVPVKWSLKVLFWQILLPSDKSQASISPLAGKFVLSRAEGLAQASYLLSITESGTPVAVFAIY